MGRRNKKGIPVHGILLLDKPLGFSSNNILQQVKNLFNAQKAGHTGSLDPLATGMLPLCFGEATKVSAFLLDSDKQYLTDAKLGIKTSTGDREGEVIQKRRVPNLSPTQIEEVLIQFTGELSQVPPMYSALKKDGKPLYKLARKGLQVERMSRDISIHLNQLISYQNSEIRLRVRCSKGTYIRTLVEDIGGLLGCGATVNTLHREFVEPFTNQKVWTLDELQSLAYTDPQALDQTLLPADEALKSYPEVYLDVSQEDYFFAGRPIQAQMDLPDDRLIRTYAESGKFLGLSQYNKFNQLQPKRVFNL